MSSVLNGDETIFRFFPYNLKDAQVHCNDIVWTNMKSNYHIPVDCFDIEFGLWYGLPNFKGSFWPLKGNKVSVDKLTYQPYGNTVVGHVLENFWFNAVQLLSIRIILLNLVLTKVVIRSSVFH